MYVSSVILLLKAEHCPKSDTWVQRMFCNNAAEQIYCPT